MSTVYALTLGLLSLAGLLVLVRLLRGPRSLDRIVAVDALVTLIMAGTVVGVAVRRDASTVSVLVVVALLGFVGSIAAARLIEEREELR